MYTYEERMQAVQAYIASGLHANETVCALGYPTRQALRNWYKEYQEQGDLHRKFIHHPKFSEEEKKRGVTLFYENGRNLTRTSNFLGTVSRDTLKKWVLETLPPEKLDCTFRNPVVKCTPEQKREAVIEFMARGGCAEKIANRYGVSYSNLYFWREKLLAEGCTEDMPKKDAGKDLSYEELLAECDSLRRTQEDLQQEITALKDTKKDLDRQVYRLRMEKDILEKAGELLKKEEGIDLKTLSNREKAILVNALRKTYPLQALLSSLKMAKSSYCYQNSVLRGPEKYGSLRKKIREIFTGVNGCYGYRRIYAALQQGGITVSEKVVRRIMREESLVVPNRKKRHYSSYLGEISPAAENRIQRNFHAARPNQKWLTDITEFRIPAGKVYLSPVIDCYDGMAVAWSIGTSPDAHLVNTMLDEAISCLKENEHPIVHSDRGGHYRWPGWIGRMESRGLPRSMSGKGCSPDNAACEGFFGRLKNEMFYGRDWRGVSQKDFIRIVDSYIHWYNEKRIKLSLGGLSPVQYRIAQGLC